MKTNRRLDHHGAVLLAMMALATSALACKLGGSSTGAEEGSPATGVEPGVGANGVVRYAGMEATDTGSSSIRQAVQARRAADWTSTTVATLYPGTVVNRIVHYGNYSLVSWAGAGGVQQGWVDSTAAFTVRWFDAGTTAPDPNQVGVPVFGTPQPVVTVPTPTATVPPPVIAPPPQPTVTTPPKPTVTAPPPPPLKPPPPATTTPPKTGFKPPKLGK